MSCIIVFSDVAQVWCPVWWRLFYTTVRSPSRCHFAGNWRPYSDDCD